MSITNGLKNGAKMDKKWPKNGLLVFGIEKVLKKGWNALKIFVKWSENWPNIGNEDRKQMYITQKPAFDQQRKWSKLAKNITKHSLKWIKMALKLFLTSS